MIRQQNMKFLFLEKNAFIIPPQDKISLFTLRFYIKSYPPATELVLKSANPSLIKHAQSQNRTYADYIFDDIDVRISKTIHRAFAFVKFYMFSNGLHSQKDDAVLYQK